MQSFCKHFKKTKCISLMCMDRDQRHISSPTPHRLWALTIIIIMILLFIVSWPGHLSTCYDL